MAGLLPVRFFERDALSVAHELLGKELRRDRVRLRITEVEAYRYPDDSANHARFGRTPRNEAMWGRPGRLYVYICYGIHPMLNIVTGREGEAAAVLVRACEPLAGMDVISERRKGRRGPDTLTGPGKVGAALALDSSWCGHGVTRRGGVELREGDPPSRVAAGRRVGIDYAEPAHRDAPWRLADAQSSWVSHPKQLDSRSAPRV